MSIITLYPSRAGDVLSALELDAGELMQVSGGNAVVWWMLAVAAEIAVYQAGYALGRHLAQ